MLDLFYGTPCIRGRFQWFKLEIITLVSTNLHQALEQENIYPHIFQGLKIFLKEWGKIGVFVVVELCTFIIDKQWFDRNIVYFLLKVRKFQKEIGVS